MHVCPEHHPAPELWLIAGTGEGPLLARALLRQGWRIRLFVVSRAAARAYPAASGLAIQVGELGGDAAIARCLDQASAAGRPPGWVVDASHPFATRISASLAAACASRGRPLLRLLRPGLPRAGASVLPDLAALAAESLQGQALLLAIGSRQLAQACQLSPGARHHARILANPSALCAAMAAGLDPDRVALLRPGPSAAIERALCRRWGIDTVLCRRSGGTVEAHWHAVTESLGLRLLLIDRPGEPCGVEALSLNDLLARIGSPPHVALAQTGEA